MKKHITIRLDETCLGKLENIKALRDMNETTTQIIVIALHELNKIEIKKEVNK